MNFNGQTENFVWNWTWDDNDVPQQDGAISDFCIHKDHPGLSDGSLVQKVNSANMDKKNPNDVYNQLQTPKIIQENNKPIGDLQQSEFRHSLFFNLTSNLENGKKQLRFKNTWVGGNGNSYVASIPEYPDKFGFKENDRFLIGSKTCGSYLFVSPISIDQLLVNGTDYLAVKTIENGESSAISIPIIFQFRMEDYYGTNETGIIGGFKPDTIEEPQNLTYTKRVGLDIQRKNETTFSFDIEVTAKYKKQALVEKVNANNVTQTTMTSEMQEIKKIDLKSL
jgi:hypothetical protein